MRGSRCIQRDTSPSKHRVVVPGTSTCGSTGKSVLKILARLLLSNSKLWCVGTVVVWFVSNTRHTCCPPPLHAEGRVSVWLGTIVDVHHDADTAISKGVHIILRTPSRKQQTRYYSYPSRWSIPGIHDSVTYASKGTAL